MLPYCYSQRANGCHHSLVIYSLWSRPVQSKLHRSGRFTVAFMKQFHNTFWCVHYTVHKSTSILGYVKYVGCILHQMDRNWIQMTLDVLTLPQIPPPDLRQLELSRSYHNLTPISDIAMEVEVTCLKSTGHSVIVFVFRAVNVVWRRLSPWWRPLLTRQPVSSASQVTRLFVCLSWSVWRWWAALFSCTFYSITYLNTVWECSFYLPHHLLQTKLVQTAMNEKRFDEAVKLRGGWALRRICV